MKLKLLALIFALALTLSLAGCGEDNKDNNSGNIGSDITSGLESGGSKVESGMQSGADRIESGMPSGDSNAQSSTTNADTKISKEKAKEIALDDAKVKESDIKNYKIKLDKDDGVLVYEIEFDHGAYEHNYEIDANTGAIREHDKDHLD